MLNWFKKFLKKEAKQDKVPFDELEAWFTENVKEKEHVLTQELQRHFEDISVRKSNIHESLVLLENAQLRNENVPPRAIQMMEGNRKTYIQEVNLLLKKATLDEVSFESAKKFSVMLHNEFNAFAKATAKAYAVLNEFFGKEMMKLVSELKQLEQSNGKIMSLVLEEGELVVISNAKLQIAEADKLVNSIKKAYQRGNELHSQLLQSKKNLATADKRIVEFKDSDRFKQVTSMQEEQSLLEEERKKSLQRITEFFSPIEKAMKKYSKMALEGEETIKAYESPEKALPDDKELKILEVFPKLKAAIEDNKLDLEDKKKEKALDFLNNATREQLEDMAQKIHDLDFRIAGVKKRLDGNGLMQELQDMQYALEHHKGRAAFFEQEILKNTKTIDRMKHDLEELKYRISDAIKKVLDIELIIYESESKK